MEEAALYRPILKKAWLTAIRRRSLWFFALFAALLGSGGELEIIYKTLFNPSTSNGIIGQTLRSFQAGLQAGQADGGSFWSNAGRALLHNPDILFTFIFVMILGVAIAIFFIWLSIVSEIGLIKNSEDLDKGQNPTINEGIDFGVKKFWPVFFANFMVKVILFIIFVIIGNWLYLISSSTIGTLLYYVLLTILALITLIISFIFRYQILNIVLKKKSFKQSLLSAFTLFRTNWLVSIELALILFVAYLIAAGLTFFVIRIFSVIPYAMLFVYDWPVKYVAPTALVSLIFMLAIVFAITAIIMSFQWNAWIALYNRIAKNEGDSRIVRTANQIASYFKKA